MAPLLFKDMKNLSCASPTSAAVCTSIDRRSMVRPTIVGKRRHNHFSQTSPKLHDPFTSKTRKSSLHRSTTSSNTTTVDLISPANSSRFLLDDKPFSDVYSESEPVKSMVLYEKAKKLSDSNDEDRAWALVPVNSLRLPSSTTRIHGEKVPDQALVPVDLRRKSLQPLEVDKYALRPSSSTRSHHDQVVVLRVSLHCKGCAGKVKKHISKMEGVTSFNIDLSTKKVTVVGNVTPLGVLNSVSKVKSAQFWPSPPRASASF